MIKIKQLLTSGLIIATFFAATISTTNTAFAAPFGMDCPATVSAGGTATCTFNPGGAMQITSFTSSRGATIITAGSSSPGSGFVLVRGNLPGFVDICVQDSAGVAVSCDSILVTIET